MAFATPVRPRSGGRDMSFESHVHELLYSNQRRQFMDDQASWDPRAERPDDLASIEYAGAKFARGASSLVPGAYADRYGGFKGPRGGARKSKKPPKIEKSPPKAKQRRGSSFVRSAKDDKEHRGPPLGYVQLAMRAACTCGDVGETKRLASIEGFNLEALIEGMRPMHIAAAGNQPECIFALRKAGAKLNGSDGTANRSKPIHLCAERGHAEAADALVKLGARVETRPGDGLGPLHIACKHNHPDIIVVLLRAGCDPDAPSREGTPREIAEMYHCTTCVDAMDDFEADGGVDKHCDLKMDSLRRQSITRRSPKLGEHVDTPPSSRQSSSRLRFRPRHGDADARQVEEAKDDAGVAIASRPVVAMRSAAMAGDAVKVAQLLARGGDPAAMAGGQRPLHAAAHGRGAGALACVRLLLEAGADVDARCADTYQAPLHVACVCGRPDVCALLLESGANANATDGTFKRPLHVAAEHGSHEVVALLLERGGDARAEDQRGCKPRDYAREFGYSRVSGMLAKAEGALVRKATQARRASLADAGHAVRAAAHAGHLPRLARPKQAPAGGFRTQEEVVDELEAVLDEVKAQKHGYRKVDALVSRASRAVHAQTPTWDQKRGSASKARRPESPPETPDGGPDVWSQPTTPQKSLAELLALDDESAASPEPMEIPQRPKTPKTPETDTANVLSLIEPPDHDQWHSSILPQPPRTPGQSRPGTAASQHSRPGTAASEDDMSGSASPARSDVTWESALPRPPSAKSDKDGSPRRKRKKKKGEKTRARKKKRRPVTPEVPEDREWTVVQPPPDEDYEPPEPMEIPQRPKTPKTPETDTANVLSLIEPPDHDQWHSSILPQPPRTPGQSRPGTAAPPGEDYEHIEVLDDQDYAGGMFARGAGAGRAMEDYEEDAMLGVDDDPEEEEDEPPPEPKGRLAAFAAPLVKPEFSPLKSAVRTSMISSLLRKRGDMMAGAPSDMF